MITGMETGAEVRHILRLFEQYELLVESLLSHGQDDAVVIPEVDLTNGLQFRSFMQDVERRVIRTYVVATKGNIKRTAELLQIDRTTLHGMITRLGITKQGADVS